MVYGETHAEICATQDTINENSTAQLFSYRDLCYTVDENGTVQLFSGGRRLENLHLSYLTHTACSPRLHQALDQPWRSDKDIGYAGQLAGPGLRRGGRWNVAQRPGQ